jgi:hypothetical protein
MLYSSALFENQIPKRFFGELFILYFIRISGLGSSSAEEGFVRFRVFFCSGEAPLTFGVFDSGYFLLWDFVVVGEDS